MIQEIDGKTKSGIYFRQTFTLDSSPTMVLVMGYGGSLETWPKLFVSSLAKSYRVITLDNRGTGLSIKPQDLSEYKIKDMAEDLEGVVSDLAIDRFHLLGYSLGGCIALEYAYRFPKKVQSLVLMSSTAGGSSYIPPEKEMLEALATPIGNSLWELYISTWRLCFSEAGLRKHEAVLRDIFERSSKHLTPQFALKGHLHAYREFDGTEYLKRLQLPVKIISGHEDRLTPVGNSQFLAENICSSKFVIMEHCEHSPHIEDPPRVLREILEHC